MASRKQGGSNENEDFLLIVTLSVLDEATYRTKLSDWEIYFLTSLTTSCFYRITWVDTQLLLGIGKKYSCPQYLLSLRSLMGFV